jgi:hypothetical protein
MVARRHARLLETGDSEAVLHQPVDIIEEATSLADPTLNSRQLYNPLQNQTPAEIRSHGLDRFA